MKRNLGIILLLLIAVSGFAQHKIVFQLATDLEKEQSSLPRQLNNVLNYWPDADIEVVVHSAALDFMIKEKSIAKDEIAALMQRGVKFAVCRNTMERRKVTEAEIIDGALIVPVGIAEIVEKQEAGYSYIKGGY